MSQRWRLATGGRINRSRPLRFVFNGRVLTGYEGDTLASALIANGIRTVARSFKYHRPRGIVGAGAEEPNAIFQVGEGRKTVPGLRATQVELFEGLKAYSVNGWPSVDLDIYAINDLIGGLLPAGFYYKTFMWPRSFWKRYEHRIRQMAGLGRAPDASDPDTYDKRNIHCDVLVVGAGPSGLMAALTAARSGARVIVADEQSEFGGGLLGTGIEVGGMAAGQWIQKMVEALAKWPEVMLLSRSTVTGYHDHNFLVINERRTHHLSNPASLMSRERMWRVRAKRVVLATGAIERPLVFVDNDRPGVMLASAVSVYMKRYAAVPGRSLVIFTNNDSAYRLVHDAIDAGVVVKGVVDLREDGVSAAADAARCAGVPVYLGHAVTAVKSGFRGVKSINIGRLSADGRSVVAHKGTIECDILAMSGGWNPTCHLHAQSGGRPVFHEANACFWPGVSVQGERSTGACAGEFDLSLCLVRAVEVASEALRQVGIDPVTMDTPSTAQHSEAPLRALWSIPSDRVMPSGKKFVDYQNDTTEADIRLAAREGYRSIEHVKRYTALGFGTDQGKLGNVNGMAILADALGQSPSAIGTTTYRPNYTPVTFGAIAGRAVGETLFDPIRRTPMHEWHVEKGAAFEDVGQWKRPWYYPLPGEDREKAVSRECLATRQGVGILDASTLGKIEITGRDAAELLDRIYTNAWKSLSVGRCRYGLMLGEDGMVMDDGVTSRLSEYRYLMTTTTGGAAHVLNWLERWLQTEWPELQVFLTSVTDRWSVTSIAGPKSRELLESLSEGIDLSPEAMPFMSFCEGRVAGIAARVFRISFSGEVAYEINVSADQGLSLWRTVMEAGQHFGITPYGTDAMHVLRAEKGYVIVGQDTDGSVTPIDLGMDWIVSKKKDFIGKRSLFRADTARDNRKQLVGLKTEDSTVVLPEGAQLVNGFSSSRPVPMVGHVTSSYFSATLGHSIALALIKGGRARLGGTVYAPLLDGQLIKATITEPVFYDSDNVRQRD